MYLKLRKCCNFGRKSSWRARSFQCKRLIASTRTDRKREVERSSNRWKQRRGENSERRRWLQRFGGPRGQLCLLSPGHLLVAPSGDIEGWKIRRVTNNSNLVSRGYTPRAHRYLWDNSLSLSLTLLRCLSGYCLCYFIIDKIRPRIPLITVTIYPGLLFVLSRRQ